jgi:hypothetical protein
MSWLQNFSAATLIAGVVAWLTWRRLQIDEANQRHTRYEQRYKVFEATRRLLVSHGVTPDCGFPPENLRDFIAARAGARFLFDDEMADYLNVIQAHAFEYQLLTQWIAEGVPEDERAKYADQVRAQWHWLSTQNFELEYKFAPFLRLDPKLPDVRNILSRLMGNWRRKWQKR